MSDAFCRLSTGSGLTTRELYKDTDEVFLDATRPIILNSIEELATRGDLIDRSIMIEMPRILESNRKLERELLPDFARLVA
jgi:hypothetical protein